VEHEVVLEDCGPLISHVQLVKNTKILGTAYNDLVDGWNTAHGYDEILEDLKIDDKRVVECTERGVILGGKGPVRAAGILHHWKSRTF
jgi:hypothetical protein